MLNRFCFRDNRGITYVPIENIVRFEASGGYTNVYLKNKEMKIISSSLCEQYEKVKDSGLFFRIHKSHLVNLSCVFRILYNGTVLLENGTELPLARREMKELVQLMKK